MPDGARMPGAPTSGKGRAHPMTLKNLPAVLIMAFCLGAPALLHGEAKPGVAEPSIRVLESSANDLIILRQGQRVGQGAPRRPGEGAHDHAPANPLPTTGRTGRPAGISARLVIICLLNRTGHGRDVGFDLRREGRPRFIARPGGRVCARVEPARHRFYFWKTDRRGRLAPTLSQRLELSAGARIVLTWLRD